MEIGLSNTLLAGDTRLIDHIVGEVKSQGIFDQFRKECIADVDTKPAYQNLRTRVEGSVNSFLNKQVWKPDLNKNQLRETLRKHIHDAPYLDAGVERIVDQVVNPKVYSVFTSQIEDVVYKFLGIERPKAKEKNGACGLKDLLPKDLDPVSPESDKNSLKDVSLESLDAIDNLYEKQEDKESNDQKSQNENIYGDKSKRSGSENGHVFSAEKMSDEVCRTLNKTDSSFNLNTSGKSDDKLEEEEEEVSPTFEPIDIMNRNECNISNDSHLSGISELTSHRSRSPDFSNELSRDNFDCSNQDSQLSKVSSDSRLSIVTDFGSSNHALTPVHDTSRDETAKCEIKGGKDNFKAIREFELARNKTSRGSFDFVKNKDTPDYKDTKDFKSTKSMSSKENSRDATDSAIKDKYEHRSSKERSKDGESTTKSSKSAKERTSSKDGKYKDKSNERKRLSSQSSTKYDKHSKPNKSKDKIDQIKETSDKAKDMLENLRDNTSKFKDEKFKEADRKDNINKEAKDLKDLYKEKIRELREKKELTEKEKLNKDKDIKTAKDIKDRKDSPKDRKSSRKVHRSSSSSSSSRNLSVGHHESKSSRALERTADGKDKRFDSKDKARRDERRSLKDSKSHYGSKSDISDRSDKSDTRRVSRSEKEDKTGKADVRKNVKGSSERTTNGKKDARSHAERSKSSEHNEKLDSRKDSKNDSPSKEKKRREDKKSKTKDDHSSLRKNSNDRRSTDRDGSNGSNSKTSPSNNSGSNATSNKSGTSNLTKENHVSNPSETSSDSIEEVQVSDVKSSHQSNCKLSQKISSPPLREDKCHPKLGADNTDEVYDKQERQTDSSCDAHSRSKKRHSEDDESTSGDTKIKKPKFARNIHEAKILMKIRKQMEKQKDQKLKDDKKEEKRAVQETEQTGQSDVTKPGDSNLESMPDYERVQIIEVRDEEYEEPYPEKHESSLTLDERSLIMLGAESCTNDILDGHPSLKPTLSDMELCIKQSLSEIVASNTPFGPRDSEIAQENGKPRSDVGGSFRRSSSSSCDTSSAPCTTEADHPQACRETREDRMPKTDVDETAKFIPLHDQQSDYPPTDDETHSVTREQNGNGAAAIAGKSASPEDDEKRGQSADEENAEARECKRTESADGDGETRKDDRSTTRDNDEESRNEKPLGMPSSRADATDSSCDPRVESSSPVVSEDNEDCRYFKTDNEKSEKFSSFLESLELVESTSLEDIIESLGGKVVSSLPRSMAAPPQIPKRKHSSSPLSDILVNNSDNNNEGRKQTLSPSPNEEAVHKKRKFAKRSRLSSLCNPQGISNGENFVMPLSPDSDVSATSDKTASSNVGKEEKTRNRSSQRYSSDDLYKPRPLFSSSSRRSRRSNQS